MFLTPRMLSSSSPSAPSWIPHLYHANRVLAHVRGVTLSTRTAVAAASSSSSGGFKMSSRKKGCADDARRKDMDSELFKSWPAADRDVDVDVGKGSSCTRMALGCKIGLLVA